MITTKDKVILSNTLDCMLVDIEECIEELGFDPRDGRTEHIVLEDEDDFGNVGIDLDGLFYVPAEICIIK